MLIVFLFLVMILSILFTIEPTNLKKSYSQISEKHEQNSINFTNVLMKSNGCVLLLNIQKNLQQSHNLRQ